jgi:hypothetical protein
MLAGCAATGFGARLKAKSAKKNATNPVIIFFLVFIVQHFKLKNYFASIYRQD